MIALVAGLIVIGAVLAFTVSSIRANSENVRATRLAQELRTAMSFFSRELRRAGYDETAMNGIGVGTLYVSAFSRMLVSGDCVIFAYDRPTPGSPPVAPNGIVDLANLEVHAFRRVQLGSGIGVIEFNDGSAGAPACNAGAADYSTYPATCTAGWCGVTDPRTVNVTRFGLTETFTLSGTNVYVRDVDIDLRGQLSNDATVARAMASRIRVRADCIRAAANVAQCRQSPA